MSTRVTHVTRTTVTRRPADIDEKVAGTAIVAAAVIVIAAAIVVVLTVTGKPVDWSAILPPVGISLLTVLVGYLRRSSHDELVDELEAGARSASNLGREFAPALEAADPAIAPEVTEVESGIDTIAAALAEADPATSGAPVPAATVA